jgi:hypothetical protein
LNRNRAFCETHTKPRQPVIENLANAHPTLLNGDALQVPVHLQDGDMITVGGRQFKFISNRPVPAVRTPVAGRAVSVIANNVVAASAAVDSVATKLEFAAQSAAVAVESNAVAAPVLAAAVVEPKREEKRVTKEQRKKMATPVKKNIA